jgi:hypothetical protein
MARKTPVLIELTDAQKHEIADLAVEKMYAKVGRITVRRALLLVGLGVSALVSAALAVLFNK